MPKEKELHRIIPKIYRRCAEDLGLFFWVKAQKSIVPTIRVDQAILSYFREIGISVDEWDLECARITYFRMQHEFYGKDENAPKDC